MKQFKARASSSGKIITGSIGLTDKQAESLQSLVGKEKLTVKQEQTMNDLIHKRDNPELPKTLTSYCEQWMKSEIYSKPSMINSKYLDKGNVMEDKSIEDTSRLLDLGLVLKNEEFFEDDYFCGTPDVILADEIIDMKNSWDETTFPLFEKGIPNMDYFYQLQVYMHLTGKRKARLIYYLSNTPDNLIEREARFDCIKRGFDEMDNETYEQFYANMTYDNVPDKLRIKVYNIEYDENIIEELQKRVDLCRTYISELSRNIAYCD